MSEAERRLVEKKSRLVCFFLTRTCAAFIGVRNVCIHLNGALPDEATRDECMLSTVHIKQLDTRASIARVRNDGSCRRQERHGRPSLVEEGQARTESHSNTLTLTRHHGHRQLRHERPESWRCRNGFKTALFSG